MSGKNKGDYEVGYGKPPLSGQFKPGQSGNPAGRKRRQRPPELKLPSFRPTQKLLRAEAERLIAVRDGERIFKIPTTEAVVRALAQKAMQGGVLAQRTYLALQQAEDARLAAEQEEIFNSWEEYETQARKLFEHAMDHGEPEPDLFPHPDDVILDYDNRRASIVGPRNAKDAEAYRGLKAMSELFYELSLFLEELGYGKPSDEHPVYGKFLFLYLSIVSGLPPRMRRVRESLDAAIDRRTLGPRRIWAAHLNERLKSLGINADVTRLRTQPVDLRDLNLRLGPNGLEEYRWPRRKRSQPG